MKRTQCHPDLVLDHQVCQLEPIHEHYSLNGLSELLGLLAEA